MKNEHKGGLPIFLIAVDGHGGSGKSTVAEALARRLGAEILHTDDFASWENPVDWWPLLIEHALAPIAGGAQTLAYTRSQWWQDQAPQLPVAQPVTPCMILEGVTALRSEFRPYIDFGIFVDTPAAVCLQRGFTRDRGMDDKSDEEILAMWEAWFAAEERYMQRDDPRAFADIVIDGTRPFDEQYARIEHTLSRRLASALPKTGRL